MENELLMVKKQLQQEVAWKEKYDSIKNKTSQELVQLRKALGSSLRNVAHDPHANMMQTESKWYVTFSFLHLNYNILHLWNRNIKMTPILKQPLVWW